MIKYFWIPVVLGLSACGGGGGSSSSTTTAVAAAHQIRVSTNVAQNTSAAYSVTALHTTVDDRCLVNASHVQYPADYLGKYALPVKPADQTLNTLPLGMGIKDNWASSSIGNPNVNSGCNTNNKTEFVNTLSRLQTLGVSYLNVSLYTCLADAEHPDRDWTLNYAGVSISDSDLVWMSQQAQSKNMTLRFNAQVCPQDSSGRLLSNYVSRAWLEKFYTGYSNFMLGRAQLMQGTAWESIGADWGDWTPNWTGVSDIRTTRLLQLIQDLRAVYTGRLFLHDWTGVWPGLALVADKVDYWQLIVTDGWNLSIAQKQNLNLATLRTSYTNQLRWFSNLVGNTMPIQIWVQIQSHSRFYELGWIEDAGCWKPYTAVCFGEQNITTDFSVQSLGVEAVLEAIASQPLIRVESVVFGGYWLGDNLAPADSFPNANQSIRNKPAEYLVYQWWKS